MEGKCTFKFETVNGPLVEKFANAKFNKYKEGDIIRIIPSNAVFPANFWPNLEPKHHFPVRADDVWVLTFPKSGTTWILEMVWLLMNKLDYETARNVSQTIRTPFVDASFISEHKEKPESKSKGLKSSQITDMKSPRCLKSHLPVQLLPTQIWTVKPKLIYVARQPKDVAVSAYHHHRLFFGYGGTIEDFVEAFMAGITGFGCILDHNLEFWKLRNEPHILFTTFEEMKRNLPGVVKRVATFLDCEVNSDQMKLLCKHLSFESMKNNPSVSHEDEISKILIDRDHLKGKVEPFMRKGEVDGWKTELTPELAKEIDIWVQKKLKDTDYPVPI